MFELNHRIINVGRHADDVKLTHIREARAIIEPEAVK